MLKNVKIRILAFFMAVTLSFCVVSSEYQEVKALEWAGTVVAFDTAMKAILGLLGVGVAVGTASQIDWGQLKDDCVEYQIAQGNNSALVGKWWNDVINGALDTGSECWASFKEWAKTLVSGNTETASVSSVMYNVTGTNVPTFEYENFNYDRALYYDYSNRYYFMFFSPSCTATISSTNISGKGQFLNVTYNKRYMTYNLQTPTDGQYETGLNSASAVYFYNLGSASDLSALNSKYHVWDITVTNPNTGIFDDAYSDLGAIGLAPDVATDLPYDGVIDIPWENVGATDTAIDDAFDDALDKVNTGAWTLDQYWTWVQNVTNVFAYDTTNNYLLPNDGDDEKADDKVQQNINRGAMVLYGLEKVFPFCIPWDIYAFVNLLAADPVAPVIEYPIYNPVSGEDEIITIDFSVWESQVILMRYIQDFLLIIGLLLLARSLIGAGGSD